jgi:hypothetical protein
MPGFRPHYRRRQVRRVHVQGGGRWVTRWRVALFSGDESQAYTDDPGKWALYDVNTIANYDPTIIPS